MDLSISAIASSLIFSTVGFHVLREGRKRPDFKLIFVGIALMAFSYFTQGPFLDWGVGIALSSLAYYLQDRS